MGLPLDPTFYVIITLRYRREDAKGITDLPVEVPLLVRLEED